MMRCLLLAVCCASTSAWLTSHGEVNLEKLLPVSCPIAFGMLSRDPTFLPSLQPLVVSVAVLKPLNEEGEAEVFITEEINKVLGLQQQLIVRQSILKDGRLGIAVRSEIIGIASLLMKEVPFTASFHNTEHEDECKVLCTATFDAFAPLIPFITNTAEGAQKVLLERFAETSQMSPPRSR
eukprot:TRINITY_DN8183_c0_g1_i2.p1 TRINITY_DN8183_c0_g1~~TRINITY_DN8183_c0_g1_i2.p1  ORF type:complete len:199 (+),score=34.46 TRINITY_DN8183_c0_g1_i2:58-597(+)